MIYFTKYCIIKDSEYFREGGVCISKNTKPKTEKSGESKKVGLYDDYSIEKAKSGDTTFAEHRDVSLENGLTKTEAIVNAIASKLAVHSDKKAHKNLGDIIFGFFRHVSAFWYNTYTALEKKRKNSDVIKRYVKRCDSLVKKAGFILSVMLEPIKIVAVTATVAVCAGIIINATSYEVVLGVYANGSLVGYLDSKSPMTTALTALESDLSSLLGTDYTVDCDIEYSFINAKAPKLLNDADCYRILYNIASSDFVDAYALYIDGEHVASSSEFDTLNNILKQLTASDATNSSIKNDIRVSNQLCLKSTIMSPEQIADILELEISEADVSAKAAEVESSKRVEVAEVVGNNDESAGLDVGIIRFSNGTSSLTLPHTLSDGTKITTNKDELLSELNLVYVKTETVTESIPYQTTYIESADYYVGTQMLKTSGREGSAEVTYEIEYNKDGELSRTAVSKNITKEPVTEVMVIGTSVAPTRNPTGSFIWPTDVPKGISSYYGGRKLFGNYDFHLGIDILNNYGNDIWAADSGVVTYAGYNGSYGYYVTIEHADGMSTLYAHMSKIYTETGAEVKQGDVIGAIGKTGVATAYHLHFEVRIDGKTVDPLDYLPARDDV